MVRTGILSASVAAAANRTQAAAMTLLMRIWSLLGWGFANGRLNTQGPP